MASVNAELVLLDQFNNVIDKDFYGKLVTTTLTENTQGRINEQVRVQATLPPGSYSWQSKFTVVADARGDGAGRAICDSTFEYQITGGEDPVDPFGDEPRILKHIVSGPDSDFDGEFDVIVEAGQTTTTVYDFDIDYAQDLATPDVLIVDTAPAEWQVTNVAGNTVTNGFGFGPDGNPGAGTIDVAAANRKTNNKSATIIEWTPDPANASATINVVAATRQSPSGKIKFKPTSCGLLSLNDGALVFELDLDTGEPRRDPITGELLSPILESSGLILAAVEDLDGTLGVVPDGSGDEDQDNVTDGDEVFVLGTDPCLPDSDGDGFDDDVDQCPIEGLPDIAAGEVLGGDGCIIFP